MRQLTELEVTLQQLNAEYVRLIKHMDAHQIAMKGFDLVAMDAAGHQQEARTVQQGAKAGGRRESGFRIHDS